MDFDLTKSLEILEKTPKLLDVLLNDLSDEWIYTNEGKNTWSPYDILGHLIHGEKTDWMVRVAIVLNEKKDKRFEPFDRFAQLKEDGRKPTPILIEEFRALREYNLKVLKARNISEEDLKKTGIYPDFGEVTLRQLIAAWAVHDLGHMGQITRVMAKQYKNEVGPWINYLGVLKG